MRPKPPELTGNSLDRPNVDEPRLRGVGCHARQAKISDRRLSSLQRSGERIETKGAGFAKPLGFDTGLPLCSRPYSAGAFAQL